MLFKCQHRNGHNDLSVTVLRSQRSHEMLDLLAINYFNSSSSEFSDKLQKNLEQDLPPHLKSVAALPVPCEIWMFNCATSLQHVIRCKCDTKSLIYSICLPDMLSSVSNVNADKFKIIQHVKNCLPQHARMCRVHDTCHGCVSDALLQESCAVAKIYGCHENFLDSLTILFPKFFMGFCSDSPCECAYKI